jgi:hypothetical protein
MDADERLAGSGRRDLIGLDVTDDLRFLEKNSLHGN